MIEIIVALLLIAAAGALSWACVVGIIKLITLCFGWPFSLLSATGIWLVLVLIRWVLNTGKSDNE